MFKQGKFIIVSVIFFLLGLTVIQFVWINRMAVQHNKQFEYTVVAALNKAIVEVDAQDSVCSQVTDCFNQRKFTCCEQKDLALDKWNFIDSIIQAELHQSKINITYEFKLSIEPHPHPILASDEPQHKCFTIRSNMETQKGERIWLHITFPSRNAFIMAQIGWLFVISLLLIGLTIWAFIIIYNYYVRERNLASDTRNFINNLTHELKTPISTIRLANSRIGKATQGIVDTTAYTGIIDHENKKLETHVNYLLDLSRLQKGKIPLNFESQNVHDLIEQLAKTFQLPIEEQNGNLHLNLLAQNPVVWADCFHLSNAFNNLLDNACKYSPNAPDISINTENKNNHLVISISDKGLGIDKPDQKNIFQEFSRVNTGNVHNVKGFGLGLAYVAQVVKLHKGNIWLKSNLGQGSTFFIKLPSTISK